MILKKKTSHVANSNDQKHTLYITNKSVQITSNICTD